MTDWITQMAQGLNRCAARQSGQRQGDAAVMILLTREPQPKVLLTRRAATLNSHRNEVSLPGGKRDPEDASMQDAALRETFEEVGIPPEAVQVIGCLPEEQSKSGLTVHPFVGLVDAGVPVHPSPAEIAHAFWVRLDTLYSQPPQPYRLKYRGLNVSMPSWPVETPEGQEVIWGLTGRILVSLARQGMGQTIDWPTFYSAFPALFSRPASRKASSGKAPLRNRS